MIPPTIAEASRQIAARRLSPVELTKACLDQIGKLDSRLSAFITVTPERALEDARVAEARIVRNGPKTPLDGIPIGHKDMFDTAGILTTANSRLLQANVPASDAEVVKRLADAGTAMLGKLATLEFALAGPSFDLPWAPTRNPWNTEHFTSGSSSGTAAAVAVGMVLGGTGTDTGGSIRGPAAMCGVSGIKPTFGRCSTAGVFPLAHTLDTTGPMAWTAEDCAMLLQEMAGFDPADPSSADVAVPDFRADIGRSPRGLRVGVIRHFHDVDQPVTAATRKAIDLSLDILRAEGAELREVSLSPLADYTAANRIIMNCEAAAVHGRWLKSRFMEYGERMRFRLALAAMISGVDYIQAQRRRRELSSELAAVMAEVDVVLTATSVGEAPPIRGIPFWDGLEVPSFTVPWNLTGYPAIAVCMGFGDTGLPLSVQLGGRPFREGTLFQVAHVLETATSWRDRRPAP